MQYMGDVVMIILEIGPRSHTNSAFLVDKEQWLCMLKKLYHLNRMNPKYIFETMWGNANYQGDSSFEEIFGSSKMITEADEISRFYTSPFVIQVRGDHYLGAIPTPLTMIQAGVNEEYYGEGFSTVEPLPHSLGDKKKIEWPVEPVSRILDLFSKLYDKADSSEYKGFRHLYDTCLGSIEETDYKVDVPALTRIKLLSFFLKPGDDDPTLQELLSEISSLEAGGWMNILFHQESQAWITSHGGTIPPPGKDVKKCDIPICSKLTYRDKCLSCSSYSMKTYNFDDV